jgi:hypothetical protein
MTITKVYYPSHGPSISMIGSPDKAIDKAKAEGKQGTELYDAVKAAFRRCRKGRGVVRVSPSTSSPGTIADDSARARLTEGDRLLGLVC